VEVVRLDAYVSAANQESLRVCADVGTDLCLLSGMGELPYTSNLEKQRIWIWTGLLRTSVVANPYERSAIPACAATS
jgi:hypothetical protein